jgi:DNA-binding NtrC family response regulator
MRIFHFNDEEKELHRYLAERGHQNTIIKADDDPFAVLRREVFDAAFVGLHPHGLRLLGALHERNPDCFVTIITSDHKTRMAVEAMKHGAFDYLLSPLDFGEVERTCILLAREQQMVQERRRLQDQLGTASAARLIGTSPVMQRLQSLIAKAAAARAPVLLSGETGTGKELVAHLLHEQGPRREKPFVSINCNAIPASLLESELFGFKKGAFTGADRDHAGLLAQADGGTFFFDEVQDLDPPLQGKLLRVLQHGEILPLGGRGTVRLDVRFIAATNQDLAQCVQERRFRQDLYYRLNVVPIVLPPLREHHEDLPLLVRHFIDLYSRREGRAPLKIAPAVWQWINSYSWPGNVRELENLCQRAVALTDGDTFDTDLLALTGSLTRMPSAVHASGNGFRAARSDLDRQLLEQALASHAGNVSRAAAALGISRTTFYEKARRLAVPIGPRPRTANPP